MRLIRLTQGSPAWQLWRADGVGASDLPRLLGDTPADWGTVDDLVEEKARRVSREATFAMRRGHRLEPEARAAFERAAGVRVRPACCEHDTEGWLRASLDGLTFDLGALVELKCPNVVDHECALAGVVPAKYRGQLQHQFFVTGCEAGWYASYSLAERFSESQRIAVVPVAPDAELMARCLDVAEAFWRRVLDRRAALAAQMEAA